MTDQNPVPEEVNVPPNPYANISDDSDSEMGCLPVTAVTLLAVGVGCVLLFCSFMVPFFLLATGALSLNVAFITFLLLVVVAIIIPFVGAVSLFKWLSDR